MNPANLQLEGLIMAVSAENRLLAERGVLTPHEIEPALKRAEARITSDDLVRNGDIRLANRDAMCFPIRVLLLANGDEDCAAAGFSEPACRVGQTNQPFNDQR
jgi:hypothetical protein